MYIYTTHIYNLSLSSPYTYIVIVLVYIQCHHYEDKGSFTLTKDACGASACTLRYAWKSEVASMCFLAHRRASEGVSGCIRVFPSASACIRGCFRLHPGVSRRIQAHFPICMEIRGCIRVFPSASACIRGCFRLHRGVSQRIGVHPRVLQAASWCFPAHRHASADAYWRTIMHCALFMLLLTRIPNAFMLRAEGRLQLV